MDDWVKERITLTWYTKRVNNVRATFAIDARGSTCMYIHRIRKKRSPKLLFRKKSVSQYPVPKIKSFLERKLSKFQK